MNKDQLLEKVSALVDDFIEYSKGRVTPQTLDKLCVNGGMYNHMQLHEYRDDAHREAVMSINFNDSVTAALAIGSTILDLYDVQVKFHLASFHGWFEIDGCHFDTFTSKPRDKMADIYSFRDFFHKEFDSAAKLVEFEEIDETARWLIRGFMERHNLAPGPLYQDTASKVE
jgi:hypothetical protein